VASVAVDVIANQPAASGYLQLFAAGAAHPVDSSVNYQQGRATAGLEVVRVPADGRISIYSTTATRAIVRLRGWYADAPAPSGADWPQVRNLSDHPGVNPSETVLTPTTVRSVSQAWNAALGETYGDATVVDGVVYAGSGTGVRASTRPPAPPSGRSPGASSTPSPPPPPRRQRRHLRQPPLRRHRPPRLGRPTGRGERSPRSHPQGPLGIGR
jgi:hypothetical protein